MDFGTQTQQGTSFIPKNPLVSDTPSAYRRKSVSILTLVSLIVFIFSTTLGAGVFLYEKYLNSSLAKKQDDLEKARASFDPIVINEIRRVNNRIEHSKEILSRHAAFSAFFDTLERSTLQNVQFKSFDLSVSQDSGIKISLKGIARNYASVALQSDSFNNTTGIKDPIFSDLNLDQSGRVSFSVAAYLDPNAFKYINLLSKNTGINGSSTTATPDDLPASSDSLNSSFQNQ